MCVCTCVGTRGGQKMILDPLELELKSLVSSLVWVLGTKLQFSGGAASTLTRRAIFPGPWSGVLRGKDGGFTLLGICEMQRSQLQCLNCLI